MCVCLGGPAHKSVCFLHADACPTHPDLPASVCQCACIYVVSFPRMLGVLRAPQRASGASSEKRETTSAPPWAAPRNARRRDAEARGPSRARVPAPTCVWVDPQTEPFEGRGKTKRMNITPRRRGKSPRPHSQPHSPVPSLLLEPSSRPTSSGGVPWEPGFKTQLVTSLRSPGRGHAQDMAGPREDGGCMRFWEARSRTGRRGS